MNAILTRARPHVFSTPVLVAALTVACAAGVLAGPPATAVPGGLLLAFVLPGVALTALIFRYRAPAPVERAVLVPALSLAVLVVAGLVLYVFKFPLDRTSWALATAVVTLAVLALKAVPERVWQGEEEDAAPPPVAPTEKAGPFAAWTAKRRMSGREFGRQVTPLLLVLALLGGAGYLSFTNSRQHFDVPITTLAAAPPGEVDANGDRAVTVSASGLEAGSGPYALVVTDPEGARVLERRIAVPAGGDWQATLTLPAEDRLTVGLLRAGDTVPYRTLYLAAVE